MVKERLMRDVKAGHEFSFDRATWYEATDDIGVSADKVTVETHSDGKVSAHRNTLVYVRNEDM